MRECLFSAPFEPLFALLTASKARNHSGVHNSIPRENGGNSASMTNGESTLNGNHEGENVNGDRSNMAVKRDMQLPIRMPKWNGHKGFGKFPSA